MRRADPCGESLDSASASAWGYGIRTFVRPPRAQPFGQRWRHIPKKPLTKSKETVKYWSVQIKEPPSGVVATRGRPHDAHDHGRRRDRASRRPGTRGRAGAPRRGAPCGGRRRGGPRARGPCGRGAPGAARGAEASGATSRSWTHPRAQCGHHPSSSRERVEGRSGHRPVRRGAPGNRASTTTTTTSGRPPCPSGPPRTSGNVRLAPVD